MTTVWGISPSSTTEPTEIGETSPLTATLWINPPTEFGFDFYWKTTNNGSATQGEDFIAQPAGYAHISSGASAVSISVPVVFDSKPESSETVEFYAEP